MEAPPPSQLLLRAEAAAAPPFFVPVSAASLLSTLIASQNPNLDGSPQILSTGLPTLDASDGVLGGGLPLGSIIGISAGSGGEGRVLALRMIVRDLLRFENRAKRAVIVDSTGSFPLQTLVEVVRGCVGEGGEEAGTRLGDGRRLTWRERGVVEEVLERVGISRVFGVEGVWDVISEIRGGVGDGVEVAMEGREGGNGEQNTEGVEPGKVDGEDHGVAHGGSGEKGGQSQDEEQTSTREGQAENGLRTPQQPPPSAQPPRIYRADDADPSAMPAQSGARSSVQDSRQGDTYGALPPLTQPPLSKEQAEEMGSSSPLSSPPNSSSLPRSISSSPLASQLIIEPSPKKQKTSTVLSQAYVGEDIPSSSESETPEAIEKAEEGMDVEDSPSPHYSPPLPPRKQETSGFGVPSGGFEEHLATEGATEPGPDSNTDTDSSSSTSSSSDNTQTAHHPPPRGSQWASNAKDKEPPSILLIDALPPLLTPLFTTSDRTTAHRQLAQLSRILTSLSRCAINPVTVMILNSTTTLSPARQIEREGVRSVFADVKCVPSFGALWEGMVDVNLMVSALPRCIEDAECLYAGARGRCRMTSVLECLRDEGGEGGRWMRDGEDVEGCGDGEGVERRDIPGEKRNREGRWGVFDVVREKGVIGEEIILRDPDLGPKLGKYREFGFGRRA